MKPIKGKQASILAAALLLAGCATTTGGVAGSIFFGHVGPSMDESDKQKAIQAVQTGERAAWRNASTGREFTVVTNRTFDTTLGQCRDYTIASSGISTSGTACRQSSGGWSSGA